MLEVRFLGTFSIRYDGEPVVIGSRAGQSLFAYLILNAGTPHRREKLAGLFWPDTTEEKARAYLRHELWRIRKALSRCSSKGVIASDEISLSINRLTPYWVDVTVLVDTSDDAPIETIMHALSLFKGELLPGFYDEWVVLEREHVQAVYEHKLARLLKRMEGERRWHDMLDWAERWISLSRSPEAAYQALMVAYSALGDHAKVASTYDRCVQALRALDLQPSEETRFLATKRRHSLHIPIPLTSFIGREREVQEVSELLSRNRLVTLTGAGGVGKTRLSIRVAAEVLDRFLDGVWFLDLAPLQDPELIANTLANLLGLSESTDASLSIIDQLIKYLRPRTALIIFDNCEHLIESAAELAHFLLSHCENLSLLATSRESLRVTGEIPYRIPSLRIATDAMQDAHDLEKLESVRLFVERAEAVSPGFRARPQATQKIAKICERLDGIPLAIELAAALANVVSVEQILKRLDDRFHLLTGGLRSALPRHRTLRATIEWSYDMLPEKESILFRRLAVFAGGWTLEAVEEICCRDGLESGDGLELLTQLVNKSLVWAATNETDTRYHTLETIRHFGRDKLSESGDATVVQDRHLAYFLKQAEEIEPLLLGFDQSVWMDRVERELDNIRAALNWSIANQRGDQAYRLYGALGWFWFTRCHFREGTEWFRQIIPLQAGASKGARGKALRCAAWMAFGKGDLATTSSFLSQSLAVYRDIEDWKEISTTMQFLGVIEFERGKLAEARPLLEESLAISQRVGNKAAIPRVLIHLGYFFEKEGSYDAALRNYEQSLAICREIGEDHLSMVVLLTLGFFERSRKNMGVAWRYYEEALQASIRLKNKRTIAEVLLEFAKMFCEEQRYTDSARLSGFAERMLSQIDALSESHLAAIGRLAAMLVERLGEERYRQDVRDGATLGLEQAHEIALKHSE